VAEPTTATIYFAAVYPEWQRVTLAYLDSVFDEATNDFPDARDLLPTMKGMPELADKKVFKGVMPFIGFVRDAVKAKGRSALASVLEFNEGETLTVNLPYLKKSIGVDVIIAPVTEAPAAAAKAVESCTPGNPAIVFA